MHKDTTGSQQIRHQAAQQHQQLQQQHLFDFATCPWHCCNAFQFQRNVQTGFAFSSPQLSFATTNRTVHPQCLSCTSWTSGFESSCLQKMWLAAAG
jgi:hypothetical protein